ncbi:MAG: GDSL-type esterase/lipase family protein [Eubacterium sp.]|nr:GDSL-type esterase/lipase family protein [Eubacterium sp.]
MKNSMGKTILRGVILAAIIIAAVSIIMKLYKTPEEKRIEAEVEAGVQFLKTQEQVDPADVQNAIQQIAIEKEQAAQAAAEEERLAKYNEQLAALQDGTIDVWSQFQDFAILGDSRGEGFRIFEFLPPERVLAVKGESINGLMGHLEETKALNPRNIYVTYGMNDIESNIGGGAEGWAQAYTEILLAYQAELPNARFFVSSILPVVEPAWSDQPQFQAVPEWNAALRAACEANGFYYVDHDATSAAHADLWEVDGIHMKSTFYPYWADDMIMATWQADANL